VGSQILGGSGTKAGIAVALDATGNRLAVAYGSSSSAKVFDLKMEPGLTAQLYLRVARPWHFPWMEIVSSWVIQLEMTRVFMNTTQTRIRMVRLGAKRVALLEDWPMSCLERQSASLQTIWLLLEDRARAVSQAWFVSIKETP
jgi:hypothetical protein